MNNLQPLKWHETEYSVGTTPNLGAQGAGIFYRIAEVGDKAAVTWHDQSEGSTGAKELSSICEAKNWIETDHYPSKMQPYVKPSPTWIKATEQQPTHQQEVIVYRYNEDEGAKIEYSLYFNADYFDDDAMIGFSDVKNGGDFLTDVYYWQPIETKALYEAMLMQLQISEVIK